MLRREKGPRTNDRLERQARVEAKAFVEFVERGFMTVEEALNTLRIPPQDRIRLEDFVVQHGGSVAREIRNVIELRDLAVAEFETLVFSRL